MHAGRDESLDKGPEALGAILRLASKDISKLHESDSDAVGEEGEEVEREFGVLRVGQAGCRGGEIGDVVLVIGVELRQSTTTKRRSRICSV